MLKRVYTSRACIFIFQMLQMEKLTSPILA